MSYIQVEGLTKKYTIISKKTKKEIYALDNLFLQVKKGEFMGYIGPNGAGKSTTIKVLTGIMVPSSGMVSVDGLCPWKDRKEHVRKIGAVFGQKTQMWWDLPVIDTYNLLRDIFRISKTKYTQQLSYILENLDLQELLEKPVRFLSLGQRMRAEIGACLIHDPDILFLDEPTIGLDIFSKEKVNNFLKELNKQGKTIFLTTHDLEDIQNLCSQIMILNNGQIIFNGSKNELKAEAGLPLQVKVKIRKESIGQDNRKFLYLDNRSFNQEKYELTVMLHGDEKPGDIAGTLFKLFEIEDIIIKEPDIEDVVKYFYKQDA